MGGNRDIDEKERLEETEKRDTSNKIRGRVGSDQDIYSRGSP